MVDVVSSLGRGLLGVGLSTRENETVSTTRRKYADAFKTLAVELAINSDRPVAEIARDQEWRHFGKIRPPLIILDRE